MRVFLFILFFSFPAAAQSPDWPRVHALTVEGIDQLYNLEFDKSERTFEEVIRIAPDDPRGWFFKSMVHFYVFQLTRNRRAYDTFFELSETVIEKAETMADNDPNDLNAKFYLGGIYGYRGLAYQRDGSVLSGVWDGRKGYNLLREAATGVHRSVDAQLGFGLFSYLISRIPRSYSWVLRLLGFEGDREGGLAMIKVAADSGVYTRTEAAFYYAQFCFFEDRFDEAYSYMRRLLDRYPDNSLFVVTYATWELRRDNVDSAIVYGEKAIAINDRLKVRMGDEYAHSTLAAAWYAKNDFARAARHWEEHIAKSENTENIMNFVYYRLGISYEILGNRQRAVETWRRMEATTDQGKPWESVYWRRAQTWLREPLNDADIAMVVAGNDAQVGKFASAVELYRAAVSASEGDVERRASAMYGMVHALYSCGEDAEVIRTAPLILMLHPKRESWTEPHALYRLGQSYARMGRTAEARRSFERALKFDDYDWELSLEEKIEGELDKLER
ncbi:MAG TPA: hypothetical protein DCX46_08935 [Bacteroidetes bacterium]|nr:hypothetical protein [Bacteroidota bacterium]